MGAITFNDFFNTFCKITVWCIGNVSFTSIKLEFRHFEKWFNIKITCYLSHNNNAIIWEWLSYQSTKSYKIILVDKSPSIVSHRIKKPSAILASGSDRCKIHSLYNNVRKEPSNSKWHIAEMISNCLSEIKPITWSSFILYSLWKYLWEDRIQWSTQTCSFHWSAPGDKNKLGTFHTSYGIDYRKIGIWVITSIKYRYMKRYENCGEWDQINELNKLVWEGLIILMKHFWWKPVSCWLKILNSLVNNYVSVECISRWKFTMMSIDKVNKYTLRWRYIILIVIFEFDQFICNVVIVSCASIYKFSYYKQHSII